MWYSVKAINRLSHLISLTVHRGFFFVYSYHQMRYVVNIAKSKYDTAEKQVAMKKWENQFLIKHEKNEQQMATAVFHLPKKKKETE